FMDWMKRSYFKPLLLRVRLQPRELPLASMPCRDIEEMAYQVVRLAVDFPHELHVHDCPHSAAVLAQVAHLGAEAIDAGPPGTGSQLGRQMGVGWVADVARP